MDQWGFDVNIYDVPDLESFLQAVLLMPRSITSDFNFPKWYYYGRGSGENGNHYEYSMQLSRGAMTDGITAEISISGLRLTTDSTVLIIWLRPVSPR